MPFSLILWPGEHWGQRILWRWCGQVRWCARNNAVFSCRVYIRVLVHCVSCTLGWLWFSEWLGCLVRSTYDATNSMFSLLSSVIKLLIIIPADQACLLWRLIGSEVKGRNFVVEDIEEKRKKSRKNCLVRIAKKFWWNIFRQNRVVSLRYSFANSRYNFLNSSTVLVLYLNSLLEDFHYNANEPVTTRH